MDKFSKITLLILNLLVLTQAESSSNKFLGGVWTLLKSPMVLGTAGSASLYKINDISSSQKLRSLKEEANEYTDKIKIADNSWWQSIFGGSESEYKKINRFKGLCKNKGIDTKFIQNDTPQTSHQIDYSGQSVISFSNNHPSGAQEGMIEHEINHIANKDSLTRMNIDSARPLVMSSCWQFFRRIKKQEQLPSLLAVSGVMVGYNLISKKIKRNQEFRADGNMSDPKHAEGLALLLESDSKDYKKDIKEKAKKICSVLSMKDVLNDSTQKKYAETCTKIIEPLIQVHLDHPFPSERAERLRLQAKKLHIKNKEKELQSERKTIDDDQSI